MFYTVSHTLTKAGGRGGGGGPGVPVTPSLSAFCCHIKYNTAWRWRWQSSEYPLFDTLWPTPPPFEKSWLRPWFRWGEALHRGTERHCIVSKNLRLSSIWSRVRDQRGNLSIRNLGAYHYSLYESPRERKNIHFQNQKHEHFQKTTPRHVQISLALDDWNFCLELIPAIFCLSNRRVTKR